MRYIVFINNSLETCLFYAGSIIAKQICYISYFLSCAPDCIAFFIGIVIIHTAILKFDGNKFIFFQFRCKYFSFTNTLLSRTKFIFCRIFPFCLKVVDSGFSIFIRQLYFTGQHIAIFVKRIIDTVNSQRPGGSHDFIILIQNSVLKQFLSILLNTVPAFFQTAYR